MTMEIEKAFDEMNNEKKGQLIDAINNALINCLYGVSSKVNHEHKNFKEFLKYNVRDDKEVVDHNIDYLGINCPIEFLNVQAIIESDNDYMPLIDNWHLNVYWIFKCNYDELIKDGVLIEL